MHQNRELIWRFCGLINKKPCSLDEDFNGAMENYWPSGYGAIHYFVGENQRGHGKFHTRPPLISRSRIPINIDRSLIYFLNNLLSTPAGKEALPVRFWVTWRPEIVSRLSVWKKTLPEGFRWHIAWLRRKTVATRIPLKATASSSAEKQFRWVLSKILRFR